MMQVFLEQFHIIYTWTCRIDMLVEGAKEFYVPILHIFFSATEEEIMEKFRAKNFPKYMPIFEKVSSYG